MNLIKADKIMIAAFIFLVLAHSSTLYLINKHQTIAQNLKIAKNVTTAFEANPISKYAFNITNFMYIYSFIVIPSIIVAIYYYYRKKYYENLDLLETYTVLFLTFVFLDFMYDFSTLLAYFGR